MQLTRARILRWVRWVFLSWAVVSTAWLANSVRTQGVDDALLSSSSTVTVADTEAQLSFMPIRPSGRSALVFYCGSGVAAAAYAPLLRPLADAGYPVFIIKLPYRFAPLQSHREIALERARQLMAVQPVGLRWVAAGHSLGGALAARMAGSDQAGLAGLVLIATTHPKEEDLSRLTLPVTKIYGTQDGVAEPATILANRRLLPAQTRWIAVQGGNHAQFGHYGRQLLDGKAEISRAAQQAVARSALLQMLAQLR